MAGAGARDPLRRRRPHGLAGVRPARRGDPHPGRGARDRPQPRVLPVHPAGALPRSHRAPAHQRTGRGVRRLATGGGGEALRPRPGLRPAAQRTDRAGVSSRLGVPHRPLPREGDRPEHPRGQVREPDVRAAVECVLRRQRADHPGRGHRHRRSGRLLRRHRGGARCHPEPPAAAARPDGHGGAAGLHRGCCARREGEGPRGPAAAGGRGSARRTRSVQRRLSGWGPRMRLPRRGSDRTGFADRDLRGTAAADRQPALGWRALLPADRQASRTARDGGRRDLQADSASALRIGCR